jgi:hypothetical protein
MIRSRDGWSLFDFDMPTQRSVWRKVEADGTELWEVTYPVDNVLAANHDARMDAMGKRHGDWTRIASVPLGFHFDKMAGAVAQQDTKYVDKMLGEYSKFRTFR